jgi:hypothetical protein
MSTDQFTVAPPQHLLYFFTGATGTRVIPPDFGSGVLWFTRLATGTDLPLHWDMRNENPSNTYSRFPSFGTDFTWPSRTC